MTGLHQTNGDDSKQNGNLRSRLSRPVTTGQSSSVETSLRDVFRVFFRHRRKIVAFFAVIMTMATLYAIFHPKHYRSEAKLFVRLGRENVGLDPTTTLGQTPPVTIPLSREEEMNSVVEVLGSRSLFEKVVDALGPDAVLNPAKWLAEVPASGDSAIPAGRSGGTPRRSALSSGLAGLGVLNPLSAREQAVVELQKQVGIEVLKKTNVILVAYEGPSPIISQRIVAKLIDVYLDEHGRMNRTPRAHQFLQEQADALKGKLRRLEDELRVLKNTTGLASPAEQRLTLVNEIAKLDDETKTTQALAVAAEAESRELAKRLSSINPTLVTGETSGHPNMAADGMRQQLYALQLKERELAARLTDKHVELRAVRDQLAAAKAAMDSVEPTRTQTTVGPNRTYEELRLAQLRQEASLTSLRAKGKTLAIQLAEARRRLETLNNGEVRIAQLQRDIQIVDGSYRKYADGLEQARIDESLERNRISNINVAEPPTLSHQPVQPRPPVILFLGFVIALFGGLSVALVAEYFDHSLKTAEEIERRLELPVLASLPRVQGRPLVVRL